MSQSEMLDKMDLVEFTLDYDEFEDTDIVIEAVPENMDLKDAIALAMKNEEIAMQKYENLAANCDDPELQGVFTSLASMEKDHKFKMEESFVKVAYPEVW